MNPKPCLFHQIKEKLWPFWGLDHSGSKKPPKSLPDSFQLLLRLPLPLPLPLLLLLLLLALLFWGSFFGSTFSFAHKGEDLLNELRGFFKSPSDFIVPGAPPGKEERDFLSLRAQGERNGKVEHYVDKENLRMSRNFFDWGQFFFLEKEGCFKISCQETREKEGEGLGFRKSRKNRGKKGADFSNFLFEIWPEMSSIERKGSSLLDTVAPKAPSLFFSSFPQKCPRGGV